MEWVIIVILLTTIVEFRPFVEALCTSLSIHVLLCGKVMLSRRLLPERHKIKLMLITIIVICLAARPVAMNSTSLVTTSNQSTTHINRISSYLCTTTGIKYALKFYPRKTELVSMLHYLPGR